MTTVLNDSASIEGLTAKFCDIEGVRTRYYEAGSGEPMLLCHGGLPGASSANVWTLNIPGLGEHFHVFAADKMGSGLTDNPDLGRAHTISEQTEHIYRFIRSRGVDGGLHLVGQSFGGYTATRIALEHPELVKTLTIVDSATTAPEVGDYNERRRQAVESNPPKDKREEVVRGLRRLSYDPAHISEEFIEAALHISETPKMKAWRESGLDRPFLESQQTQKRETLAWIEAGRLTMPVLLHWGANDPTAILAQGQALFELIARTNARLRMVTLNHAGHFHFREYPAEFNENVIRFIRRFGEQTIPG
ncbi:MAG: alpha/beta hydrolase [Chloroflexi bacterium]|nr:alpha/beta hydrolase [Chloroflexota bacterium]